MKYRCPYCAEKTLSLIEKMGFSMFAWWRSIHKERIRCSNCQRLCARELWTWGRKGRQIWLGIVPYVLEVLIFCVAVRHIALALWLWGALLVLYVLCNLLFEHFDKFTKEEQDADAKFTLFVPEEKMPRVKKWHIYLVRFPKRGTNAASPVLYGMVCGKTRKEAGRQLELRVIRTDNMDLPAIDEPAWLITDSDKVVEGTVTAVTPSTDDPRRYRRER